MVDRVLPEIIVKMQTRQDRDEDRSVLPQTVVKQRTDSSPTRDHGATGLQGNNNPRIYPGTFRPKLSLIIPNEQHLKSPPQELTPRYIQARQIPSSKHWPPHGPLLTRPPHTGRPMRQPAGLSTARRIFLRRRRAAGLALEQASPISLHSRGSESSRIPHVLPEALYSRPFRLPRLQGTSHQRGHSQVARRSGPANGRKYGRTGRRDGDEVDFRTGHSSCGMFWPPW
ncbi:hypothetical protein GE09DRAFT_1098770 [Coniochaeta sp. 2T2.1]|nr:hypothetical protein GE09DRAFT_1098770 [Coniochaeta sp. 2T2.1]